MLNKINQARVACKSRNTYSRNLNAESRLTVFTVHRMLQKIGDMENNKEIISHIRGKIVPNSSVNKEKPQQQQNSPSITKRQYIEAKNSRSKFGFLLRQSESKMKCQKKFNKQIDTNHNSRNYRTKYCKTIESNKCSDFNKSLVDKMKKIVNKTNMDQTHSQQKLNYLNFGLNIKQIKNVNFPKKLLKKKQRISVKMQKSSINSQLYQQRLHQSLNEDLIRSTKQFNPCALCKSFTSKKYQSQQLIEKTNLKQQDLMIRHIDCPIQLKKQKGKNKIQEISSFHKKISKMFNCLNIFLNSFHAKLDNKDEDIFIRTVTSNSVNSDGKHRSDKILKKNDKHKYTYFLGAGNNSNLIRSIFRKRNWWSEVTNINSANFVWTQLRSQPILQRMQECKDDNYNAKIVFYQQLDQQQHQNITLLHNSCKKSNSTANSDGFIAKQSSFNLIFHNKQNKKYYSILDDKQSQIRLQTITTPQLLHNHYSCNYMFGNKNALYYNISHYYQFIGKNLKDIVPLTFYLEKNNKKSFLQFETVYNQSKKKNVIWIMKPAQNSNRGQGIQVTTSLNHIKSKLNSHNKLIVQYYIKNLLLYNSRKFDIRTYMIGLTFNGRTKFYWYEQGYIRTASQIYDLQNLTDRFIHLTNDAVQKKGEYYGRYQDGNKLSYHQFQRYLDTKFQRQNWQMTQLHQEMKFLAKDAVKAIQCRINPNKKAYTFELFGLDFIIDNQFKPYLIEINTNPCLELCSSVLQRLIPRMMQNIFRICVDPIFRPKFDYFYSKSQSYYIYDETFLDRNKFALIFDDKYDRDFEWEQRCKMMRGIEWSTTEQDEYADQGNIITVDY